LINVSLSFFFERINSPS